MQSDFIYEEFKTYFDSIRFGDKIKAALNLMNFFIIQI